MAVLVFSMPFVTLAQQNTEVADAKSIAAQKAESENQSLIATAKVVAERDVIVDFGSYQRFSWFSVGFGCSFLGVAAAYLQEAQPPSFRLLGKSPEYVEIYGNTYQNELRKNRMVFAGSGCAVSLVLLAVLLSNDASDNSLDVPSDINTSSDDSLEDACLGCLSLVDLVDSMSSCLLNDSSCMGDSSGCLY